MSKAVLRVVGWVGGLFIYGYFGHTLDNTGYQILIGFTVMLGCVYIGLSGKVEEKAVEKEEIPINRAQRRHPNGRTPAQKFKTVNARGRQKQGNNKAVRGW